MASGPLNGVKVIEFGSYGPTPFCAMILSDLGADVVRVDRPGIFGSEQMGGREYAFDSRGRRSLSLNLKSPADRDICLELMTKADIVLDGYRPGVLERLGLGPDVVMPRNRSLLFGRLTGWGQTGSYAKTPGYDANFIALSGILYTIGTKERPVLPLNMLADYMGAFAHAVALLAAYARRKDTGEGQVVDTALSDVATYAGTIVYGIVGAGKWRPERQTNILDGGAPWGSMFECADGEWVVTQACEPPFYACLLEHLGLTGKAPDDMWDEAMWPAVHKQMAEVFATKTRDEWSELMEGTEACVSPVLAPWEAMRHPRNVERGTFVEVEGIPQPAPPYRLSATPAQIQGPPPVSGAHNDEVLRDWGIRANADA